MHLARLPILLLAPMLHAQTLTLGSSNPATAEPPVPRPSTTPCTVPLFTGQQFIDYTDKHFTFTPPASCPGPWAKVVFNADFNVSAGRQFDRTGSVYIGGADVYFGTTAEPRAALSPSWHVERDITELSALLGSPQPVLASLGNFFGVSGGVDYNGIITGSASLQFYPADAANQAPAVPDAVLPLNPAGGITSVNTTADRLTQTFGTLPRNVERAYLQVFSQSQGGDEFWYTSSPDSVAAALQNTGGTGFRETEIYVDGTPAGIAPVFPWIYTGGIDPALWEPIVGVETLNFKPYSVDLTPFSAQLSDGAPHTVALGVFNTTGSFSETATLLLYLDHGSRQTTGALTANTLGPAPTPAIQAEAPVDASGTTHGKTLVSSVRHFNLAGYVDTSHGRVTTALEEQVNFGNYQLINFNNAFYSQDIAQLTTAQVTTRREGDGVVRQTEHNTAYPFTLNYNQVSNADGSGSFTAHSFQQDFEYERRLLNGFEVYSTGSEEQVGSTDSYKLNTAGAVASRTTGSTTDYRMTDTEGRCYSRALTSSGLRLTAITDGADCGGANRP